MTHGSKSHRQHGSIGSSATPSRVFPGLKMAGQMGNKRKTLRNLQVYRIPRCVFQPGSVKRRAQQCVQEGFALSFNADLGRCVFEGATAATPFPPQIQESKSSTTMDCLVLVLANPL